MKFASLRRRPAVKLPAWVAPAQLADVFGSVFTVTDAGSWYATSVRPWFAPPNWMFDPVWVTLFTFTGVVAWLVSRYDHPCHERALAVLVGHLVANVAWSVTFSGLRPPAVGPIVIVVLLAAILAMTREFAAANRRAVALLVPYPL